MPHALFNEFGLSLAKDTPWIWFSHEIEFNDGTEVRKLGWKLRNKGLSKGAYARIWIGKHMAVITRTGFKFKKKDKLALKLVIWFEYQCAST